MLPFKAAAAVRMSEEVMVMPDVPLTNNNLRHWRETKDPPQRVECGARFGSGGLDVRGLFCLGTSGDLEAHALQDFQGLQRPRNIGRDDTLFVEQVESATAANPT